MKLLTGLVKLTLGIFFALVLMSLVGVAATRYFIARLTAVPPKPAFANDTEETYGAPINQPEEQEQPATELKPLGEGTPPPEAPQPEAAPAEQQTEATPEAPAEEAEGYAARVTQPIGLILRQDPSQDAEHIGGVEYESELVVLSESDNGEWQKVKLSNDQVGWVKGGNTEPVGE
ncbi:MAG: SH3 domain-containing protein [Thainema sp.]